MGYILKAGCECGYTKGNLLFGSGMITVNEGKNMPGLENGKDEISMQNISLWKGIANHSTIEKLTDDYAIFNLDCPECNNRIGTTRIEAITLSAEEKRERDRWAYLSDVFQLSGEGGSITFKKDFDDKTFCSWYYYVVKDMGFIEEDIPPSTRKSTYCLTLWEALVRLFLEKPYFHNLHPSNIDEEYHDDILSILRLCYGKSDQEIDYQEWANALSTKIETIRTIVEN